MPNNSLIIEGKEFEERSDYINEDDLITWNVQNDYFDNIQKELLGVGVRLLVGPRGTGKTHQMKIAYQKCLKENKRPIAIFVSLNKYFHLEPLLTKAPNALQIFHTWVLTKIILGCYSFYTESFTEIEKTLNSILSHEDLKITKNDLVSFESKAESPYSSTLDSDQLLGKISISKVLEIIDSVKVAANRSRAIILLDDAALTLTPEYFVEFLDIFRSLKTSSISPKASVYPGTTQYSPRFHVGHDAQFVQCWMSVENERYSEFMESLIDIRFANQKSEITKEILELFKYASFGVPRTLIGLIRGYGINAATDKSIQSRFNKVIDQRANLMESEYLSLKMKIPQYDNIIQTGWYFFKKVVDELKEDNKLLSVQKNYHIGILDEENKVTARMINFIREAGLIYEEESAVKHGDQREYKRYIPHLLFLFQNRTFAKSKGFNPHELLAIVKAKSKKHPLRRTFNTILNPIEINNLKLNLPACQVCNTPRLSEEQKFCHNCGNQLINQSTFEYCMNMTIDSLPLTSWQKESINSLNIGTIGDFLTLSNPGGELRKIKGIGKVKSQKIATIIQDTVKDMLNKTLIDFLS